MAPFPLLAPFPFPLPAAFLHEGSLYLWEGLIQGDLWHRFLGGVIGRVPERVVKLVVIVGRVVLIPLLQELAPRVHPCLQA